MGLAALGPPYGYNDHGRTRQFTHRTQLEMWVSRDEMKSWYLKRAIVSAPRIAMYPDGFFDAKANAIYLVWEDSRTIFFQRISLTDL